MDEHTTENIPQERKNKPKLLWGIGVLGVIAMGAGIFWYANSQQGFPLFEGSKEPKSMEAALGEAALRFTALRARLEQEQISEEIIEELVDIRKDLAAASKGANEETLEQWRVLDQNLEDVEQTLRESLEEYNRALTEE